MSSFAAAKAFAKETWNKQFFQDLERAHQTHYEQMGRIHGDLIFCPDQTVLYQNQIIVRFQTCLKVRALCNKHNLGYRIY